MLNWVKIWIVLSALTIASGWCLSLIGCLNIAGYLALWLPLLIAGYIWVRPPLPRARLGGRLRRRFRRWPPAMFAAFGCCALLGGLIYTPTNVDAICYRIPRVFHWLAEGRWHWIHTTDWRMNVVGTGMEWFTAPLLLFTRSDRFLFAINFISFLLLPGLLFFVFRKLGVKPRVAWWWMWLFPTGFCYVIQAGGAANDSFSAVYILAAIGFAFQAKEQKSIEALWISLLAAALASGTKQTNVALLFPWLVAIAPALYLLLRRPWASVPILGLAGLCSFLPITVCNLYHTGAWTGWPPGQDLRPPSMIWGLAGNAFAISAQNLAPPIFPWASQWNALMDRFVQTPIGSHFSSFEHFARLYKGERELISGLGLMVTSMLLLAGWIGWRASRNGSGARLHPKTDWHPWLTRWAILPPLLLFMSQVGSYGSSRYLAPFYPLMVIPFLAWWRISYAVRHRGWQKFSFGLVLITLFLVVVSRERPLWPGDFIGEQLVKWKPNNPHFQALHKPYFYTRQAHLRVNPFASYLTGKGDTIGYAARYDALRELLCWQPIGKVKVYRVTLDDTPETLAQNHVRFLAVQEDFMAIPAITHNQWLEKLGARRLGEARYHTVPDAPEERLFLWEIPGEHHPENSSTGSEWASASKILISSKE